MSLICQWQKILYQTKNETLNFLYFKGYKNLLFITFVNNYLFYNKFRFNHKCSYMSLH